VRHLDEALDRAWQRRHEWMAMANSAKERLASTLPQDPVGTFAEKLQKLLTA
jgi:hypothetical protein